MVRVDTYARVYVDDLNYLSRTHARMRRRRVSPPPTHLWEYARAHFPHTHTDKRQPSMRDGSVRSCKFARPPAPRTHQHISLTNLGVPACL